MPMPPFLNGSRILARAAAERAWSRLESARRAFETDRLAALRALEDLGRVKLGVLAGQLAHLADTAEARGEMLPDPLGDVGLLAREAAAFPITSEHAGLALTLFGACLTPGEFAAMAGAASFDLACAEAADMSPGLATLLGRDKQPGSTILSPLGTSDLLFAGGLIHCCAPVPGGADAWKLAEDYAHAVDREIGEMEAFRNRLPEIRGAASEQEEALVRLAVQYDAARAGLPDEPAYDGLVQAGCALRRLLDVTLLQKDGTLNPDASAAIRACLGSC